MKPLREIVIYIVVIAGAFVGGLLGHYHQVHHVSMTNRVFQLLSLLVVMLLVTIAAINWYDE